MFSETDEDIARYSVMHCCEQLFGSKYRAHPKICVNLRCGIE